MTRIERSIEVAAPPEDVFQLLTDLDRLEEWATIAADTPNPPEKPLQPGQRWKHKVRVAGVTLEGDWHVVAVEAPRYVEYQADGPGGSWLKMKQRVQRSGRGSRVELDVEYELPLGVLGEAVDRLYVERRNEREADESLRNLKNLLESQH